jgi:hypothetical protein
MGRFLGLRCAPVGISCASFCATCALLTALTCAPQKCAAQSSTDGSTDAPDAKPSAPNAADDYIGPGPAAADQPAAPTKPYSPTGPYVPPTPAMIETWLASGDPRMVAWGAHYAAETHDVASVPALIALANRWQRQSLVTYEHDGDGRPVYSDVQIDQRDAMAGVLDALIQFNAEPSRDALRELATDFPANTAIFLARMPANESNDLRLEFFRDPSYATSSLRYIAAALLAREPQMGFAAKLMSGIRVRAEVAVVLPNSRAGGSGTSADCGIAISATRDAWPPTPYYGLHVAAGPGAVQLLGGAEPVYSERFTAMHFAPYPCAGGIILSSESRRRLVAMMLGVKPEAISWQVQVSKTIVYRSQPQYEADLLAFVNGEIEKERATAEALADKNLIVPGDVASALPEIFLIVDDQRGQDAAPLQEPTNFPSQVLHGNYHKWPEE